MSEFHNPYHFVPLGTGAPPDLVPLDDFTKPQDVRKSPHITHDRFVPETHSGRIVCKATVETPLICGNIQEEREGWTKLVGQFELESGKPAIPGSALRGMISSIAEVASHSALRVLANTALSHRMAAREESLSAIGILVEQRLPNGTTKLMLQPLTVPTTDQNNRFRISPEYGTMFRSGQGQPLLKGYIDGYRKRRPGEIEILPGSFIADEDPNSYSADNHDFWYTQLSGPVTLTGNFVVAACGRLDSRSNRFLLAQQMAGKPISQAAYDALPESDQARYTRGFLRVLGITKREKEIPTSKKHEYFIPYPTESETVIPRFEATDAIDRFHALADQRTEEDKQLPFEVKGSLRNAKDRGRLRLRAGDLVFFRPDPIANSIVAEVSVSSIWRAGNGTVHEYFRSCSPELLPHSPARNFLTLVEQLFGTVEVRDKKQETDLKETPAFALASRVRVSHARLHAAPESGAYQPATELWSADQQRTVRSSVPDVPLKNLASPKPPSPALYFKSKNGSGAYIPKKNLNPGSHAAQGRKFYLRRPDAASVREGEVFVHPERLKDSREREGIARQHQSVENFVRPETVFYFHLDFDNLTELELQLLTYSLQPTSAFRHQLGHGKPLGLGQIRIEIAGLLEINRQSRYLGDLNAPRFHQAFVSGDPNADWPEALRCGLPSHEAFKPLGEAIEKLASGFNAWAAGNHLSPVLRALECLGDPASVRHPVHYPQASQVNVGDARHPEWRTVDRGDASFEQELYQWFVQNDDAANGRGQYLAPLVNPQNHVASVIPSLDREQRDQPPGAGYGPLRSGPPSQPRGPVGGAPPHPAPIQPTIDRPQTGKRYPFRVAGYDGDRIKFKTTIGNRDWVGYLDIQKTARADWKARIPLSWTGELKVKGVNGDLLQLEPPVL